MIVVEQKIVIHNLCFLSYCHSLSYDARPVFLLNPPKYLAHQSTTVRPNPPRKMDLSVVD